MRFYVGQRVRMTAEYLRYGNSHAHQVGTVVRYKVSGALVVRRDGLVTLWTGSEEHWEEA